MVSVVFGKKLEPCPVHVMLKRPKTDIVHDTKASMNAMHGSG